MKALSQDRRVVRDFYAYNVNSPKLTKRSSSNDDGNTNETSLEKKIHDIFKNFALSNILKYFSLSNVTRILQSLTFVWQETAKKSIKKHVQRLCFEFGILPFSLSSPSWLLKLASSNKETL